MRVALICNMKSSFPLLNWLDAQGVLVGIGIKEQKTEFSNDLSVICKQKKLTPQILKKENLYQQLSSWLLSIKADIVLVLGFPYKIPNDILQTPQFGFYNIHFGKLPIYGGSFPIFWQIVNQETEAILTIHQMDLNFDSGPIAVEIPFEINTNNTFGIIEANYSYVSINGVFQLLDSLLKNTLILRPQVSINSFYFKKPSLIDIIIDWNGMTAKKILALIKACNPWNRGAIARINGMDVKIIEAKISITQTKKAGEILEISQNGMQVSCIQNMALDIKVIYSQFGYLEGENLGAFGVKEGDVFEEIIV